MNIYRQMKQEENIGNTYNLGAFGRKMGKGYEQTVHRRETSQKSKPILLCSISLEIRDMQM